jgi:hypothetical protein
VTIRLLGRIVSSCKVPRCSITCESIPSPPVARAVLLLRMQIPRCTHWGTPIRSVGTTTVTALTVPALTGTVRIRCSRFRRPYPAAPWTDERCQHPAKNPGEGLLAELLFCGCPTIRHQCQTLPCSPGARRTFTAEKSLEPDRPQIQSVATQATAISEHRPPRA